MLKTITPNSIVTLHFAIKLKDGSTAENTRLYKKPAALKWVMAALAKVLKHY